MPDCQLIVIDRPRAECEASMAALGLPMDMSCYDGPMEEAKAKPKVTVIKYEDLDKEATIRYIWSLLTRNPFPHWLYEHFRWMHIEPSKKFFNTEFVRRSQNPAILAGWLNKDQAEGA